MARVLVVGDVMKDKSQGGSAFVKMGRAYRVLQAHLSLPTQF